MWFQGENPELEYKKQDYDLMVLVLFSSVFQPKRQSKRFESHSSVSMSFDIMPSMSSAN